jgi:ribosomal protein L11 methyltransferase
VPFLELRFNTIDLAPDAAEAACFALGASAVTLSDAGDDPILEPSPGTTPLWPNVTVSALFPGEADAAALSRALAARLQRPTLEILPVRIEDRLWEREWLKDFKPRRHGRRLWVCPGGQPPSPAADEPTPVVLALDPGLAFGTGTHASTALCLAFLDRAPLAGRAVLDFGCGSGILAIAALLLGASRALAVDIDAQALTATRENAERNHVRDRLEVRAAAMPLLGPYALVLANILAEPLISERERLAGAAGAELVLAGILLAQAPAVAAAYDPWFDMRVRATQDGWALLVGGRRER